MDDMFNGCKSLININLSNFNTEKFLIKNLYSIFNGCKSLRKESIITKDNRILYI